MAQARSFNLGGSSRTGLLIAAILAAVTGVLVFILLQGNDDGSGVRIPDGDGETTIVTAAELIPAGTEITDDMLELTKVPTGVLLAGVFSDRSLVEGRIARYPIYAGEQLVQDKLATESEGGISGAVPAGMRGIAIGVNRVVSPGGLVRPGDRVDILVVMDVEYTDVNTERSFTQTRSLTLGQNIEVLAVEDRIQNFVVRDEQAETAGTTTEQPDPDRDGGNITLAVAPQAAQNLLLADAKGEIRLSVRARGDDEIVELPNSSFIDLADPEFAELLRQVLARPE
jgi:pilus assembly protein CpaB